MRLVGFATWHTKNLVFGLNATAQSVQKASEVLGVIFSIPPLNGFSIRYYKNIIYICIVKLVNMDI
jgi:hypothetical protein